MKVTEGLVVEHTVFSKVFNQIERALPGLKTLEEARLLGSLVEALLQNHGSTEENLFYLTLDHEPGTKSQMDQLHREHQEIDARLRQAQLAGNLEEARQLLTAALQTTREHFRHEERVAFPLIEQQLHAAAQKEFGHAWMHADSDRPALVVQP